MGSQALYPRMTSLLRTAINFSASGDNVIVAANSTKRIIVHRLWFIANASTSITFKDNLSSPGAIAMAANGALVFDTTGEPWFITDVNTAFIMNQSGTAQVSGICFYTLAV